MLGYYQRRKDINEILFYNFVFMQGNIVRLLVSVVFYVIMDVVLINFMFVSVRDFGDFLEIVVNIKDYVLIVCFKEGFVRKVLIYVNVIQVWLYFF